jgi:plasmid stabilization system protein ParE
VRVTWSDTGDESVDAIERYLSQFSEDLARQWVVRIRAALATAALDPRSRRKVPEVNDDHIREALIGPYRAWYRIYDLEDRALTSWACFTGPVTCSSGYRRRSRGLVRVHCAAMFELADPTPYLM